MPFDPPDPGVAILAKVLLSQGLELPLGLLPQGRWRLDLLLPLVLAVFCLFLGLLVPGIREGGQIGQARILDRYPALGDRRGIINYFSQGKEVLSTEPARCNDAIEGLNPDAGISVWIHQDGTGKGLCLRSGLSMPGQPKGLPSDMAVVALEPIDDPGLLIRPRALGQAPSQLLLIGPSLICVSYPTEDLL